MCRCPVVLLTLNAVSGQIVGVAHPGSAVMTANGIATETDQMASLSAGFEEALLLNSVQTGERADSFVNTKIHDTRLGRRHPGSPTSRIYRNTAAAYAAATVVIMPIITPPHVAWLLRPLGLPQYVVQGVLGMWGQLTAFRDRHLFSFLCAHEVCTDVVSDVVAQAVTVDTMARGDTLLSLDWRRVGRSTTSAMLSDDFPFLLWSRLVWSLFDRLKAAICASRLPSGIAHWLVSPLPLAFAKMVTTQVVYEPVSSGAYLLLQSLLRGDGWQGALNELSAKLGTAWRDGLIYWSFAHMVVFMIPYWWLQPIADNVATLAFNAYLSVLSNSDTSTKNEAHVGLHEEVDVAAEKSDPL